MKKVHSFQTFCVNCFPYTQALILLITFLYPCAALYGSDVTLAWDANTQPIAGYKLHYGTASGSYSAHIDAGNSTTCTVQNLASGTYYFAVTAYDSTGSESDYSNEVSTTIGTPPSAPANLSPANGATGVSLTLALSWSASAGAASYDVYFGTSHPPPLVAGTSGTHYAPAGLTASTAYYWKVAAKNGFGSSSSATQIFTTAASAPPAPANLSPANGAIVSRTPTLSWSPSPGAAVYDVYLGTSSTPPRVTTTTSTHYNPQSLRTYTTYYWRVAARNSMGSSSSPTVSFTVGKTTRLTLPRLPSARTGNSEIGDFGGRKGEQYTGIAFANLGTTEALLRLTAYSPEGLPIAGQGINNPVSITLKPGQQIPVIDAQLFGDAPGKGGWVQVESSSDAIAGYLVLFDDSLSILDGVPVPGTAAASFVLPEIENQGFTQIRVGALDDVPATLTFSVIGADGNSLQSATRSVAAGGSLVESFAGLFPQLTPVNSAYLLVTSDQAVAPLELFGNPGGDIKAINGLDAAGGSGILYAPQVVNGGGWRSSVSVINLDSTGGTVTFRLRGNDGVQIGEARTESIAANGKIHLDDPNYFGEAGDQFIQGYLEITSSGPRITGSVTFGDPEGIAHVAALPLVSSLENSLVFPQVASDETYFTGVVLLNPNESPVRATLEVYAADGTIVGSIQEVIPAGGRECKLLTEYLPALIGKSRTSGYIRVNTDQGIAAFALFGTQDLSSLAALPALPVRPAP